MNKDEGVEFRLPAPKWVFVLLGLPTFYMPVAYIVLVGFIIVAMLTGSNMESPEWLRAFGLSALYVTFILWPIYIGWAAFSKKLAWREKIVAIGVIVLFNMFGMPAFFIFMVRRYLGIEARKNCATKTRHSLC